MDNTQPKYGQSTSQQRGYHDSQNQYQNQWNHTNAYGHQHQVPSTDYLGYPIPSPHLPMGPLYAGGSNPPRPQHHQLQPLIMPQWPSMMASQSTYARPITSAMPVGPMPISPPIPLTPSQTPHTGPTPRRTLTDADRRRMCLYHEEHPTTKQSEIGALFGVERSTVSKVLRQKEKYLLDDGSRSPIKRPKGKFPDIERALAVWAKNHQRQGLPLSDTIIKEKARFFATTVGNSDSAAKITSSSWLEKFKLKNNLLGAKSRKSSNSAEGAEKGSASQDASGSPSGRSPTPPWGVLPAGSAAMDVTETAESATAGSSGGNTDFTHVRRPGHSLSNTSLSSAFTDTTPSSFSPDPTSPNSPFFPSDSANGHHHSPYIPSTQSRMPLGNASFHRPRSQTFPLLNVLDSHTSPVPSHESLTPKYPQAAGLDYPVPDASQPHNVISEGFHYVQPTSGTGTPNSMPPPPPPTAAHMSVSPGSLSPEVRSPAQSPSQEEARQAMEVVMNFFQGQPPGSVEPQDYMTMGKLMERLKLRRGLLPGGLHSINERDANMAM